MAGFGVNVDFNANLTRFSSALDKATADLSKFQSNAERVGTAIKGSLAGLGAGLSVGAFAAFVKGSIDALDNLNDLNKKTGISVEQLSGLGLAAKQSGSDLEGTASAINKLSKNIGADGEKYRKLGITAKEPLEAFKQLADIFSSIEDPQKRAALASEALGKSWESAAPLLAEGGQSIGEMVEKGMRLSHVTTEAAEAADKFNDQLAELKAVSQGLGVKIASDMLGPLTEITGAIKLAYEESGKLQAAWVALGAAGAFLFTDDFASNKVKLENLRSELAALEFQLKKGDRKDAPLLNYLSDFFGNSSEEINAKIVQTKRQIEALEKAMARPAPKQDEKKTDPGLGKRVDDFIHGDEAAKKYDAAIKKSEEFIEQLKKEAAFIGATAEEKKMYEAEQIAGEMRLAGVRDEALLKFLNNAAKEAEALKSKQDQLDATKALGKADLEAAEAHTRYVESLFDGLKHLKDDADAQKDQNDRLGMSKQAIAALDAAKLEDQATTLEGIAIKRLDKDLDEGVYNLYKAQAAELRRLGQLKKQGAFEEDQLEAFKKSAEEAQKITDNLYENIQRNLGDEMFNLLDGNFKSIGDSFKRMLLRMVSDAMAADVLGAITGKGNTNNLSSIGTGLLKLFGGGSDATGGPVPYANYNAKGGAYDSSGRVQLFSKGGAFTNSIVSSPTLFKFAKGTGLMGEAGPEAIMPLRRGPDGSLGVQSNGGSGKTVVINQTNHFESGLDKAVMAKQLMDLKERTKAEVIEEMSR